MKKSIRERLSEYILEIMSEEQNKENYEKFKNTINDLKVKNCIVKYGWCSGQDIQFSLIFEKGGDINCYDAFIEGIDAAPKVYYFLMGLFPERFHFNPITVVNTEERLMLMIKFLRNG